MNERQRWHTGFTLIELLIVVAIIAILAAIAVPNFLEAQTRSKVSRVKSDLRTIATAVEAYAVDWGVVPIGFWESSQWQPSHFGLSDELGMIMVYVRMTTPVAYMTNPPLDVFSRLNLIAHTGQRTTNDYAARLFAYNSIRDATLQGRAMAAVYVTAYTRGATWVAHSLGPSYDYSPDPRGKQIVRVPGRLPSTNQYMGYPDLIYDPTNGTISYGYIIRDNKEQY